MDRDVICDSLLSVLFKTVCRSLVSLACDVLRYLNLLSTHQLTPGHLGQPGKTKPSLTWRMHHPAIHDQISCLHGHNRVSTQRCGSCVRKCEFLLPSTLFVRNFCIGICLTPTNNRAQHNYGTWLQKQPHLLHTDEVCRQNGM